MTDYKPTIGLEIHAELKTKTKMFCDSKNDPDEKEPNVNICPICMAHPGTLPVINKQAVKHVLKMGLAVGGTLADFTEFDRKNYFYPDIPKGYQISQYKYPLVSRGNLRGVDITRIHLEEDTARSQHEGDHSLIDFNRAGVPLMELVTEPVIKDAITAVEFARELQLILRYLGASDANMEKGEMRVEANISISKTDTFGTKVEIKNLNSFRVVERAILYEIKRQEEVLTSGGKVVQETRGWNDKKRETFSQRAKEDSHDYRYFPDPDLPKLKISEIPEFSEAELKKEIPELPGELRERFKKEFGIKDEDVESYVNDVALADFFVSVAEKLKSDKKVIQLASNYITNNLLALELDYHVADKIDAEEFGTVVLMANAGEISSNSAVELIVRMAKGGKLGDIKDYASKEGLLQKSGEDELMEIVKHVISENTGVVEEYRGGKEVSLKYLLGQAMKESKGAGNPKILESLLKKELSTKQQQSRL